MTIIPLFLTVEISKCHSIDSFSSAGVIRLIYFMWFNGQEKTIGPNTRITALNANAERDINIINQGLAVPTNILDKSYGNLQ